MNEQLVIIFLPIIIGGELTAVAPVTGGTGLTGGVVSIPLSSIIFSV